MSKETKFYKPEVYEQVVDLLRQGTSDTQTARITGTDRKAVARVRHRLGIRMNPRLASREDRLKRHLSAPDADGHRTWSGSVSSVGVPVLTYQDTHVSARKVSFEMRAGRNAVGIVKAECGRPDCIAGDHMSDEIERRSLRMQERGLYGLDPQPWDVCPKELHHWDTDGRLQPDLTPYCMSCNTIRAARVRKAKRGETNA